MQISCKCNDHLNIQSRSKLLLKITFDSCSSCLAFGGKEMPSRALGLDNGGRL